MWPEKLKSIIDADPHVHLEVKKNIGHDTYSNYVHQMLHQFREQTMDYQTQLIERKQQQRFNHGLTLEMEEAIENFVEQYGITFHRILIEGQITVINTLGTMGSTSGPHYILTRKCIEKRFLFHFS
jgi:uncharacterized short protein YbdD (DUF466 family)